MAAYYNEHDPKAAAWIRELIKAGAVAPGEVDERSIVDVRPDDLKGFVQKHFFAGVAVWSYALRNAGWRDDMPIWTGSCPCQPFSAAGKGEGVKDERHLWPVFFDLIDACRPGIVMGEQVSSAAVIGGSDLKIQKALRAAAGNVYEATKSGSAGAHRRADEEETEAPWLDLVFADLERASYAVAASSFSAASVGAPHIRQRLYWVAAQSGALADAASRRISGGVWLGGPTRRAEGAAGGYGAAGELADTAGIRLDRRRSGSASDGRDAARVEPERLCDVERLAHASGAGIRAEGSGAVAGTSRGAAGETGEQRFWADLGAGGAVAIGLADADDAGLEGRSGMRERAAEFAAGPSGVADSASIPGPTNGFWGTPDWLLCRDGKWRPVESGTQPLVASAPARVGRLRGYGNAINAEAARIWIEASLEVGATQ